MASVTNVFTSTAAKGNREDLSNVIDNITPSETPLLSMIGSRSISNTVYDWQIDADAAPDTTNAQSEGFVFTAQSTTPTTRLGNTAQIFTKNATVSRTQEKINSAGRSSELAYQMAKRARELKTSIDKVFCSNQARSNGDPRKTRGLEHFCAGNASSHGTGYVAATDEFGAITSETATRVFSEAVLLDTLQAGFDIGAEVSDMLLPAALKRKFSTFAGRDATQVKVSADEVTNKVTWYISDFGELRAHTSRSVRTGSALLIDPSKLRKAVLRGYETRDEPVAGDVSVRSLTTEIGLEVLQPAAIMVITGLAAS